MKITYKILAVSVAIIGLLSPISGGASSLDSALDGMFTNLTHGGVVKTPDRTAFVGGGLALRAPISNVNLVTFDPPRLSAGCGGLDMFGGSFSFVNSQQLVALFRKVASNAVGLAFKAAIAAINPQLSHLMDNFQKLIADANNVAKNSCALAQIAVGFISPSQEAIDSAAQPINAALASASGMVDDWSDALNKFTTKGAAATQQETAELDMTFGNSVWNMINAKNLAAMLTNPTATSSSTATKDASEILMSITGLSVHQIKSAGSSASGALMTRSGSGDYAYTLEVSDLLKGGTPSNPLRKFKCDTPYDGSNQSCLNPTIVDFTFQGMQGYVNSILNGVDGDGVPNGGRTLVQALASSEGPTEQQKILLASTQVPVQAFLNSLGSNQDAQQQTMNYLSKAVANGMLISYMNAVNRVTRELQNNPTSPLKQQISQRIDDLRKQSEALNMNQLQEIDTINKVALFVETARKGNIAAFYTANKAGTP